ncbi:MAG: sulfatase-like hydrolase/transferase, partial [Verrucomicrobiota bacterium]|nr:sulfatase-like hydrolase/transferase [Verrucomicrobiota bacterium]
MKTSSSLLFLISGFTLLSAQKSPNILYVISDDQAWTDYGFMGHPQIKTPHLDKLSRESVLFERGYVPTALCRPSLATLVNGQYAHKHGITGNDPSPKTYPREKEVYNQKRAQLISYLDKFETLPNLLGEKGYLSHQSGKWWEGNFKHGGFTHGMTRGFPEKGGRHGDDGLKIGRSGLQPIEEFVDHSMKENKP